MAAAPSSIMVGPTGPMPSRVERRLREVAREHTGIVLGPEKATLLAARVGKRLRALGLTDYETYLEHFEANPSELQQFINVITTNTTAFWREADHFDVLRTEMLARLAANQRRFRIWCAASSTGQEPYTIALTVAPLIRDRHADLQILATDIDTEVLRKARAATYNEDAMEGVPNAVRSQGFEAVPGGFRVIESVRRLVRFAPLNLTRPPFPMQGPIDFIFCRNVMIYLDLEARGALVREFERILAPGGVAMIGHSESLTGLVRRLRVESPSVYRQSGKAT